MSSDAEENPSLRQRFGEKVAAKIRAQNREKKVADAYTQVRKKFRPRKSDLGSIVLIAATKTAKAKPGERVTSAYRGKVYAFYVTKNKVVRPYVEKVYTDTGKRRRKKSKVPIPYRPHTLDPHQFPTASARKKAVKLFVVRGDRMVPPVKVVAESGNVRWHETVVPLAVDAMRTLAMKATGGKGVGNLPMMVDVTLTVETPDGRERRIQVSDDFGQRKEQGTRDQDFYTPYFTGKIYALLAERLSMMGLVSAGSAKRVGGLRENRGKKRSKWTKRGAPWAKRDFDEARVSSVVIEPRLIRVTNK
jgi:hypothetical protein